MCVSNPTSDTTYPCPAFYLIYTDVLCLDYCTVNNKYFNWSGVLIPDFPSSYNHFAFITVTIAYVDVDLPNLGSKYFNFLGGGPVKKNTLYVLDFDPG